jgi:hypothetical protein
MQHSLRHLSELGDATIPDTTIVRDLSASCDLTALRLHFWGNLAGCSIPWGACTFMHACTCILQNAEFRSVFLLERCGALARDRLLV